MFKTHGRPISLNHTFSEAWEFLRCEGPLTIETDKRGTPFVAVAKTTRARIDERVIIFYNKNKERARSYSCCWGYYDNCNRTRIGMYCRALDFYIQ